MGVENLIPSLNIENSIPNLRNQGVKKRYAKELTEDPNNNYRFTSGISSHVIAHPTEGKQENMTVGESFKKTFCPWYKINKKIDKIAICNWDGKNVVRVGYTGEVEGNLNDTTKIKVNFDIPDCFKELGFEKDVADGAFTYFNKEINTSKDAIYVIDTLVHSLSLENIQ